MSLNYKFPISVFIIAKDEADRLPKTLAAIQDLSDDIILVDSGSTDRTVEIAQKFGVRVVVNEPFPGYGEQKRFGEDQCRNDWVLNIDADEVLSAELRREIKEIFSKDGPDCDGFRIRIVDLLPGEERPGLFQYSLSPVRLYRRSCGRYNPSVVHDRVDMARNAKLKKLKHPILHYSVRSLGSHIEKLLRYADWQSSDLIRKNKTINKIRIFFEFPFAFVKSYILRRYILRGTYGFLLSINYAYYRLMRIVKFFEKNMHESPAKKNKHLSVNESAKFES